MAIMQEAEKKPKQNITLKKSEVKCKCEGHIPDRHGVCADFYLGSEPVAGYSPFTCDDATTSSKFLSYLH